MALEDESENAASYQHESGSAGDMYEAAASRAPIQDGSSSKNEVEPEIDDRGTDQIEASQILKKLRDGAFDSSDEKLALALGRPTEEVEEWTRGAGTIDGDVLLKARALALGRGLQIE
jgi:hypothetical protein